MGPNKCEIAEPDIVEPAANANAHKHNEKYFSLRLFRELLDSSLKKGRQLWGR